MTILSKILDRATILGKIEIFILDMSAWSKMTILSKILLQANIFGKIEIFRLDMSALVKNDNLEQNT